MDAAQTKKKLILFWVLRGIRVKMSRASGVRERPKMLRGRNNHILGKVNRVFSSLCVQISNFLGFLWKENNSCKKLKNAAKSVSLQNWAFSGMNYLG